MYTPHPLSTDQVRLPEDLLELTEEIAANVHEVWAKGRMDEGWTFGEVKDPSARTTPLLVPYHELPESEKEYDRRTALETLKMILLLGYTIEKK